MRYISTLFIFFNSPDAREIIGRDEIVSIWLSVDGRGGAIYRGKSGVHTVIRNDEGEYYCSCPSFLFRKQCKHVEWLKEDLKKVEEEWLRW